MLWLYPLDHDGSFIIPPHISTRYPLVIYGSGSMANHHLYYRKIIYKWIILHSYIAMLSCHRVEHGRTLKSESTIDILGIEYAPTLLFFWALKTSILTIAAESWQGHMLFFPFTVHWNGRMQWMQWLIRPHDLVFCYRPPHQPHQAPALWALPEPNTIRILEICKTTCQITCQNRCKIECQIECHNVCQIRCQIECKIRCPIK